MNNKNIIKLSYPDSVRILDEVAQRNRAIDDVFERGMFETREAAKDAVNDMLYETAQKTGMSLYDLCFRTVPQVSYRYSGTNKTSDSTEATIQSQITLIPVEFDLTHDGGYWKRKYYDLKRKMQDLINSKDDETINH